MARIDEFYSSDRLKLPEESAFAGYMRGFMGQRASMNASAMEAAQPDTSELADQSIELRRRLGDLAKLKEASSRGDSTATAGILEAMLRYEGTVQSARLRGQAQVSSAQIRARETALRNAIRQNAKLEGELGIGAESDRFLSAMGDEVGRSETTAPRTAVAKANEALNAVLSNEKATAGSAKADAATYRAYQELVAAGQPEAAAMLWTQRGYGPTEPAAYMAERWGMETPVETIQLQREIERGGVGRADSAGALVQRYEQYGTGGTSTTSTRGSSTGGTPAQPASVRTQGVPLNDALAAFMANPSDSSTLDALIADTQRAIAENEAQQARARTGNPALMGRLPNLLLANPFQVTRTESYDPYRRLAAMEQGQRDETVSTLMTTRGPFGQLRPEVAEQRQAAMGGMSPAPVPWANVQGGGPSVFGWLYGRLKLAEQQVAGSAGAPRQIVDDGGWAYEQRPDGSLAVTAAPPGSDAVGKVLTSGDAHKAITAKFGGYVHPAVDAVRQDVARLAPQVKARMGGVAAWLARGDAANAGREALTLAQSDGSTFGEAYSAALETAAANGDGEGAAAVLDAMAALPEGTGGPWSDAYMTSIRRGTLQQDMPQIGAAVRSRPMFEMESVYGREGQGPADVPAAHTFAPQTRNDMADYQQARAIRAAESAYYGEMAPFSFSEEEKRRLARATAEKVVGGQGVAYEPPQSVASPVRQPVPVTPAAPPPVATPTPVMDFGTTTILPSMAALPSVANPLTSKQAELASLIATQRQDPEAKARKQQLTDEINTLKATIAASVDPSLASME